MKKLTIFISEKQLNVALRKLRQLGLVHIKHIQKPHANLITSLEHKISIFEQALDFLGDSDNQKTNIPGVVLTSVAKETVTLKHCQEELSQRLKDLSQRLALVEKIGHVSSEDLNQLRAVGVFVKLYKGGKRNLKYLPQGKIVKVIARARGQIYLMLLGRDEKEHLDLPEVKIPQESPQSLEKKIHNTKKHLEIMQNQLVELATYKRCLKGHRHELGGRLEFGRVRFGAGIDQGIAYLQGFCPKEAVANLEEAASKNGWAVAAEEPLKPEEVPTLIRNPRWIEIIRPVFKFMGTVPGYDEFDISFWFLLSFSLFFAMLIGDAGYGCIFLIASLVLRRKFKNIPQEPFILAQVLSVVTIVWGAVTGTWFGVEQIAKLPGFNYFVIGKINSFIASNQNFMIGLCFIIGAVHLTIAHLQRAFAFMNSLKALAQIGWVLVIWGIFFIAGSLVLGNPLFVFTLPLLIAGLSLIILFSNPQKNFLKGAVISLADLPLSVISSFSDLVSYLRLFAVGYATVIVASSFNSMALAGDLSRPLVALGAALILVLGHSLNILLGFMAVIVHGVRLNMLEFSGHLGMQWSGKEYEPFSEQKGR